MGFYSPNVNVKGAKPVYTSQSAVSVGSSALVPMLVVGIDPAYMQDSFSYADGYEDCAANTSKTQVIYTTTRTASVKANEWRGQYIFVSGLNESRLIDGNTAAASGANVTVYVAQAFSSAPSTTHVCNIRRWEKLYVPKFMSSLDEFAETYIAKDSTTGDYTWTNSGHAFDTISNFKRGGGGFFSVLPCEVNATMGESELIANLSDTDNADFLAGFELLPTPPDSVVLEKDPSLPVTIQSSNWSTADSAWSTWVTSRATDDTADEDLTAMQYITDTPSASASSAITYRATTFASVSPRVVLCHGFHTVADQINVGISREVNCAALYAGTMNRVSNTTAESFGNAFAGTRTAVGGVTSLSESLTLANRILLQSNGINALIFKRGDGFYFENEYTQKENTSVGDELPEAHLHVMVSRNKIWRAAKAILKTLIDKQNVVGLRTATISDLTVLLDAYKTQSIIRDFTITDATTSNDESLGIVRFNMSVLFPVSVKYVEITINSRI